MGESINQSIKTHTGTISAATGSKALTRTINATLFLIILMISNHKLGHIRRKNRPRGRRSSPRLVATDAVPRRTDRGASKTAAAMHSDGGNGKRRGRQKDPAIGGIDIQFKGHGAGQWIGH